eukprot:3177590-Alexandrium_andersonii.AAC.1
MAGGLTVLLTLLGSLGVVFPRAPMGANVPGDAFNQVYPPGQFLGVKKPPGIVTFRSSAGERTHPIPIPWLQSHKVKDRAAQGLLGQLGPSSP